MTTVLHGSTVTESFKGRQQSSLQTSDERDEFELTVLIPCLNEERTIANCVRAALDTMARHAIAGEVLVSDNGSTDASVEIAIAAGARVVSCPSRAASSRTG